jgi:hypothetical protein
VRYGTVWSDYVGGTQGDLEEIFLHPGESVIQVSGKYKSYVKQMIFVTDKGRYLPFGKASGTSFNAVPLHPNTVLRFISGRSGSAIDSISLHWDTYPSHCNTCWMKPTFLSVRGAVCVWGWWWWELPYHQAPWKYANSLIKGYG